MVQVFNGYSSYKEAEIAWLDSIPSNWEVAPLKYGYKVVGGSTPKTDGERFWDGDVIWITPADLSNLSSKYVSTSKRTITNDGFNSCGTSLVPIGSVIISTRAPIGSLAINLSPLCTNQGCKTLVQLKNGPDTRFLYYWLSINSTPLNVLGRGSTFLEISGDELGSFDMPIPSPLEQRIIANFLDHETAKIDALIDKQQQLIKLLQEKRQAVVSHAVTKGLTPDAPMKDSGVEWLGQVPEHWVTVRIKQISNFITSGPRGWSELISDDGEDTFLQSGDLNNELEILPQNAKKVMAPKGAEGVRTKLMEGDVVVCITGANTGRVAVVQNLITTTYINQHLSLIRPIKSKANSAFIGYALTSQGGRSYFDVMQYGLKEGLSLSNVAEAPLALPPLSEQKAIVESLVNQLFVFTKIIGYAENQITLLQERRTALISAAVTGKIDVRNWQPSVDSCLRRDNGTEVAAGETL